MFQRISFFPSVLTIQRGPVQERTLHLDGTSVGLQHKKAETRSASSNVVFLPPII